MGIFDIFTGDPLKEAAEQSRGNLQQTQQGIATRTTGARDQAADYFNTGYNGARINLGRGYGDATNAINAGAGGAQGYLDQGQQGAMGQLAQARGDLTAGGGAYADLDALAARYGGGGRLYGDSLGINGAEGNQRATGAFQAGPGYNFMLDQGIEALRRRDNAAGMPSGGNQYRDTLQFGQGLANQEYGSWQDRLKGIGDQELQATAGAAAGNQANNTTLAGLGTVGANLANAGGVARAGVATGQGQNLADIARSYYGAQAGNDVGQYGALAGNVTGAANQMNAADLNIAPQVGKTFMDEGNAAMQGSQNLWNFGMNAAKLAAGGLGGLPTGATAGFVGSATGPLGNTLPFGGPR